MKIEPLHFSTLKQFARSPAHFKAALEEPRRASREMDLGALAHRMLLGPRKGDPERVVTYEGIRRGKAWDTFAEEHQADMIVKPWEFATAEKIANAVRRDETAAELMAGAAFEFPLAWEEGGLRCETGGIDIINASALVELKTTTNTEPARFQRHAMTMLYPQQLEWYRGGLVSTGYAVERVAIIGVEVLPPYAVTVLELTPELLAWARRSIVLWLERLRVCIADDHWPAYRQRAEPFGLPPWLLDAGPAEEDEESEPEEAA